MPSWSETTAPCWLADGTAVSLGQRSRHRSHLSLWLDVHACTASIGRKRTGRQERLALSLSFACPCLWSTSSSAPHHAVPLACGRMQACNRSFPLSFVWRVRARDRRAGRRRIGGRAASGGPSPEIRSPPSSIRSVRARSDALVFFSCGRRKR